MTIFGHGVLFWAGVLAALLVAANGARYGVPWWRARRAARPAIHSAPQSAQVVWVEQIVKAAGATASAEFVLKHLRAGSTVSEVMADRIKVLEAVHSP